MSATVVCYFQLLAFFTAYAQHLYCNHQSGTVSGEFNSNWGRLLRTMRVRLDSPFIQDDFWNKDVEKKIVGEVRPRYTKTLDMRIAWGPTTPRLPGK